MNEQHQQAKQGAKGEQNGDKGFFEQIVSRNDKAVCYWVRWK